MTSSTDGPDGPARLPGRPESFLKLGEEIVVGEVHVDPALCEGCGLCASACGGGLLEVVEGTSTMTAALPVCIACADCVAICPRGAITLTAYLELTQRYRFLRRGDPSGPRRF